MEDSQPILSRWTFFRHQLLMAKSFKLVLGGMTLLTALLSGFQAWRFELAPEERPHLLLGLIPDWPWSVYLCISLGCEPYRELRRPDSLNQATAAC